MSPPPSLSLSLSLSRNCRVTLYDLSNQPLEIVILDSAFKDSEQNSVINTGKKIFDIAFQSISGFRVISTSLAQHLFYYQYSSMRPLTKSTRERSCDKRRVENIIQNPKNRVVQNSIPNCRPMNMSSFRVANPKVSIIARLISFIRQISMQGKNICLKIFFKLQNIRFILLPSLKNLPGQKEIFRIND